MQILSVRQRTDRAFKEAYAWACEYLQKIINGVVNVAKRGYVLDFVFFVI